MLSEQNFFIFLTSSIICVILVPFVSKLSVRVGGVDIPDDRKVHTRVTPRLGGVAIFCSLLFTIIFFCEINSQVKGLLSGAIIIFLTGLADDLTGLTPRQKFAGEFVAASLAVFMGGICVTNLGNPFGLGVVQLGPLAIPFTLFGIVGVINAINLLDGLDGLAGGTCAIASVAIIAIAYQSGNATLFTFSIALLGSIIGFLRYNNYPAQIFMGDSGSLLLGYFMGVFSVMLATGGTHAVSPYISLIILGVPILDTVTVMVIRKRSGKRLFSPDKTHLHHRLLDFGFGHRFTVLLVFGLSYLFSFLGIFGRQLNDSILILLLFLIYAAVYGLLLYLKTNQWRIHYDDSSNKSLRDTSFYRMLVCFTNYLVGIIKILVICALALPLFLSQSDIRLFSIIPMAILLISIAVYQMAPTWQNEILQIYIYSVGFYLIFMTDNYGRTESLFNITLLHFSYIIFLLLLLCTSIKIFIRKRTSKLIVSPFEYLIMLIVLSVPLMPATLTSSFHLSTVAAKSVILFVGFKIIHSKESRKNRFVILAIALISSCLSIRFFAGS